MGENPLLRLLHMGPLMHLEKVFTADKLVFQGSLYSVLSLGSRGL